MREIEMSLCSPSQKYFFLIHRGAQTKKEHIKFNQYFLENTTFFQRAGDDNDLRWKLR